MDLILKGTVVMLGCASLLWSVDREISWICITNNSQRVVQKSKTTSQTRKATYETVNWIP